MDNMNNLALFQSDRRPGGKGREGCAKTEQFLAREELEIETDDRKDVMGELERIRSLRHI